MSAVTRALILLPLLALAAPAAGQTRHDSTAPLDFDAGYMELQDKANRAILSGGVVVRQAEMTLNASRVTIAYTGQVASGSPQASRIDASGGVTITRPDQRAKSQYAIYDLNKRQITMLGGVSLLQGGNTLNGGRLTINLDSGRAVIDGAGAGGKVTAPDGTVTRSGGRVSGRFSVPKRAQ
jgi:lipopolysaccharide export system protein LptA